RFVDRLLSSADLDTVCKARVGKKLKKCLHLLLNEEPDIRDFVFSNSSGVVGSSSQAASPEERGLSGQRATTPPGAGIITQA
ncbi:unnamed protein product, partial [Amoebophrya sp. A25]